MSRSTLCKTNLATRFAADAVSSSLHASDPGGTGAAEIAGGSPAYARKPPSWTTGSGSTSMSTTFDVGAGTTVGGGGFWDVSANWLDGGTVTPFTFTAQGKYVLNASFSPS